MTKLNVASPTRIPPMSKYSRCSGSAVAYVQPTSKEPARAVSVVRVHLSGVWGTGVGTNYSSKDSVPRYSMSPSEEKTNG